jgi:hypothetical protein
MIQSRSTLIRAGAGRTRVLRLHADGERCWSLAYTVEPGQAWCRVCDQRRYLRLRCAALLLGECE